MKDYSDFAEQVLSQTSNYLNDKGLFPISGPIVCFHNIELKNLDVELGWQITQKIDNRDDMVCDTYLPPFRY